MYWQNTNGFTSPTLSEEGYPDPSWPTPPPPDSPLPPAGGGFPIPVPYTYSAVSNLGTHTYRWAFDEALKASPENARMMMNDLIIQDALFARMVPTLQLPWHLDARDQTDPAQEECAEFLTGCVEDIPNWQVYLEHMQWSVWYGRSAVFNRMNFDYSTGPRRFLPTRDGDIDAYQPYNGDKLVFQFDGRVGVLVNAAMLGRRNRSGRNLADYFTPTDRGLAHFFSPAERECLVVHKYRPHDPDFSQGELAGGVHGVGVRGRIYWFWYLKQRVFEYLNKFLEQASTGVWVFFFDSGNPAAKVAAEQAAQNLTNGQAILFPRFRGYGGAAEIPGVQRLEPSAAGANLLLQLVTGYFDGVIRRFILGQTLTNEAGASEVGGGAAEVMADHLARVIQYDAINLQETITRDLIVPLAKYNRPGVPPPKFRFEIDRPNVREYMEAAQVAYQMGLAIDGDDLRAVTGLPKPESGHDVLAQNMALQPAGVGQVPEGQPATSPAGPVPAPDANGDPTQPMPTGQAAMYARRAKYITRAQRQQYARRKSFVGDGLPREVLRKPPATAEVASNGKHG